MPLSFEATIASRRSFLKMLENYSLAQLNYIPPGYNNNLFWNIAHCAATMQLLVYSLSDSQWRIPKEIVKEFKIGTKPERPYTQEDLDAVKAILVSSAEQCQRDYEEGYFGDYKGLIGKVGFDLKTIEDAIEFNLYHEGMHMGYVLAMRRFVLDIV